VPASTSQSQLLLPEWSAELTTVGGLNLKVRPASETDEAALLDLFGKASLEDLRFRFLTSTRAVPRCVAHDLSNVDHQRTEDLLAFDASDRSLAASAMIVVDEQTAEAEVAIIVRADLKGQGVGRAMLAHACDYAKARGIRTIRSMELRENRSGIELEEKMGFSAHPAPDDMSLTVLTKSLA
jgi:GNAT superfamily N-acetyltransferase